MDNVIQRILESAIQAPSGDNSQPWQVKVQGTTLDLFNLPERDNSLYNWERRASYVSHGAFLENMSIAARHAGYDAAITLFPEFASDPDHVARIELKQAKLAGDPLYAAIPLRMTTRKVYWHHALSDKDLRMLENGTGTGSAKVRIVTDAARVQILAKYAGRNEEILFGNKHMHDFFFGHVTWTKEEDAAKKTGFYIDTLELPPPARLLFPLWKHWPIMKLFAAVGFPKIVAKENAKLYASGSAIGAIIIPDITPEHFVEAGRALERVWLTTANLGLSFQPLTGIPFLHGRIVSGLTDELSSQEIGIINEAYAGIASAMDVKSPDAIAMLFRIGVSDPPSARSKRLPVTDFILS